MGLTHAFTPETGPMSHIETHNTLRRMNRPSRGIMSILDRRTYAHLRKMGHHNGHSNASRIMKSKTSD